MRFSRWITKTTYTHSEYVILTAFSKTAIIARASLKVTLQVHFLSFSTFIVGIANFILKVTLASFVEMLQPVC